MSTTTSSKPSAELLELISFLSHDNPQVRVEAMRIFTQLSATDEQRASLTTLNVIRPLVNQMSEKSPLDTLAITALIQLSADETLTQQMIATAGIVNVIVDTLRSLKPSQTAAADKATALCSLLANVTRIEDGAQSVMQDNTSIAQLHIRRLFQWFMSPPPFLVAAVEHLAAVLLNISQIASGRSFLLSDTADADMHSQPVFSRLIPLLSSQTYRIRLSVITLFRNLFLIATHHSQLLSKQYQLMENVLLLVCGEGEVRDDEKVSMSPLLLAAMNADHPRESDPDIRLVVCEIVLLCARHKPSRLHLKSLNVYPILREWHQYEKKVKNEKLDEYLYDVVAYFILDEDNTIDRQAETMTTTPTTRPMFDKADEAGDDDTENANAKLADSDQTVSTANEALNSHRQRQRDTIEANNDSQAQRLAVLNKTLANTSIDDDDLPDLIDEPE